MIQALPPSASWALQHLQGDIEALQLANAFRDGTAVCVSDGSLKGGLGTAAFILEGNDGIGRLQGVNKVPGPIKEGDSHRCEVSGLYAIALLSNLICKAFNIPRGRARIACDNIAALALFDPEYIPNVKHSSYDLVSATWELIKESPLTWVPEHIKGHQDDWVDVSTLPRVAQMNVAMDHSAKNYWLHLVHSATPDAPCTPVMHDIYKEGWQLWAGDNKIINPSTPELYSQVQNPITKRWWVRNTHLTWEGMKQADWDAHRDMHKGLPGGRRRFVTKMSANYHGGIGVTAVEWKLSSTAECPRCPCQREDWQHALRCSGHGADLIFEESMEGFLKKLDDLGTHPGIKEALPYCLRQWRKGQNIQHQSFSAPVQAAILCQDKIGWQDLFEGLLAKEWRMLQQCQYSKKGSRKSSRKWMKSVLLSLHHMAHKLWEHRNQIKVKTNNPQLKLAGEHLDSAITDQLLNKMHELYPEDRHRLRRNLLELLSKSTTSKQQWYGRALACRQLFIRDRENDRKLKVIAREQSPLWQWFQHPHAGYSG